MKPSQSRWRARLALAWLALTALPLLVLSFLVALACGAKTDDPHEHYNR
jgi:hypothetical protein